MHYQELFHYTKSKLESADITNIDIQLLISAALEIKWSEIYLADNSKEVPPEKLSKLDVFIKRKNAEEPTLLITGYTEFYGYPFKVFPHVLIPRPETEQLVSLMLKNIPPFTPPIHLLEIGSGSGVLCTSVAMELIKRQINFKFEVFEISPAAYQATLYNLAENLRLESINGRFKTNLFEINILSQAFDPEVADRDVDIIISNPPYLTTEEYQNLDKSVKNYEPKIALEAGSDGLLVYKQIMDFIDNNQLRPSIYLEIGPEIAENVRKLFAKNYPKVRVEKDLFGLDRFLLSD